MKKEFGGSPIFLHFINKELPQEPEEHADFWNIWKTEILEAIGSGHKQYQRKDGSCVDYLFSSEEYGWKLAEVLGAEHITVNPLRTVFKTSGTKIRENPMDNWLSIAPAARSYFCKRIYVLGPESTGKTSLCISLANRYGTIYVPEYGRDFYEMRKLDLTAIKYDHMSDIAIGHEASIESAIKAATRVLFIDTDAFATKWFSQKYFGEVSPIVEAAIERTKYDLAFLCDPTNTPWVPDALRNLPDSRQEFFTEYAKELDKRGVRYKVLRGSLIEETADAARYINRLIGAVDSVWF